MSLESLNRKIENNKFYIFTQRHKRVITIIEGLFVIGLLISIDTYIVKDYFIKKQIADRCGYTTSKYECVCEESFVNDYKALQRGEKLNLSFVDEKDVPLDK